MSILYLMIPMGIIILVGALWAYFWAVDNGQFDDLESPGWRILLDDDSKPPTRPPDASRSVETQEDDKK